MPNLKVFEHQAIRAGEELLFYNGGESLLQVLHERYITALWKLYDEEKRPFFKPIRNGIRFCEWVGVIKVLDLTLEILPKADNDQNYGSTDEQAKWQGILIDMLRVCRRLHTPTVSDAALRLKSNSLLDLYIQRFIDEVCYLLNSGLIKKYRREEVNSHALKGKLLLQKNITKNIVHQERFYTARRSYDKDHLLHQILSKAIKILPRICNNQYLVSLCYQLQLQFPEVSEVKIDAGTFDKLVFDRKSAPYEKAIQIAKLLLLNYRPDVSAGNANSIAILFDMNNLWEEYVYRVLVKGSGGKFIVHNQRSTGFWNHQSVYRTLKPDIVIEGIINGEKRYVVVDTKWKNIYDHPKNVSMDDLRQMFAYHHYFEASSCYLLYPGTDNKLEGKFSVKSYFNKLGLGEKNCGVLICQAWEDNDNKKYLNPDLGEQILQSLGFVC